MATDPKLLELAIAAEAEQTLPVVRLATPAQLIVGVPGPASKFTELTWEAIEDDVSRTVEHEAGRPAWTKKAAEKRIQTATEKWENTLDEIREGWGPTARAPEPDPPAVLTIYNALIWAWGEPSGLRVPAVRVQIESVSAWWVGRGDVIKGSASGGGWFAFVALPIGN